MVSSGFRRFQPGRNPASSGFLHPTRLIVKNLADSVSENDLQELFSEFGNLVSVSLHLDQVLMSPIPHWEDPSSNPDGALLGFKTRSIPEQAV